MDRLTPQYIVRKYSIPLPSTLGVTPTPETPAQPLPLPLQTPTLYEGRGFEGVGVGVDVFLPRGYPCHSLVLSGEGVASLAFTGGVAFLGQFLARWP